MSIRVFEAYILHIMMGWRPHGGEVQARGKGKAVIRRPTPPPDASKLPPGKMYAPPGARGITYDWHQVVDGERHPPRIVDIPHGATMVPYRSVSEIPKWVSRRIILLDPPEPYSAVDYADGRVDRASQSTLDPDNHWDTKLSQYKYQRKIRSHLTAKESTILQLCDGNADLETVAKAGMMNANTVRAYAYALAYAGLLYPVGRCIYKITKQGILALKEDECRQKGGHPAERATTGNGRSLKR